MADFASETKPENTALASLQEKPSALGSIKQALGGLSMREKVLIWGLIVLAVIMALVFFLILPANDNLTAAETELQILKDEEVAARLVIANSSSNQEVVEAAQARYDEYIAKYQAPMLPEDIDRMLTALIEDCGFTAATLSLNPYTVEGVPGYYAQSTSWELPHPSTSEGSATGATGTEGSEGAEGAATGDSTATGTEGSADAAGTGTASEGATSGTEDPSASLNDVATSDTGSSDTSTGDVTGGPQAQVFVVQMTAVGTDESFYALLDRVVPLSWVKLISSTYTPLTYYSTTYNENYSFTFKIYVNSAAEVKAP